MSTGPIDSGLLRRLGDSIDLKHKTSYDKMQHTTPDELESHNPTSVKQMDTPRTGEPLSPHQTPQHRLEARCNGVHFGNYQWDYASWILPAKTSNMHQRFYSFWCLSVSIFLHTCKRDIHFQCVRYAGGLDAEGNCRGPGVEVARVYIAHSHWFPLIGLVDTYIVFKYMGMVGGMTSIVSKLLKAALAGPPAADGGSGSSRVGSIVSTSSSINSTSSTTVAGLIRLISLRSSISMGRGASGGVTAPAVMAAAPGGADDGDDIKGDAAAEVKAGRNGRNKGGKAAAIAGKLGSSSSSGGRAKSSGGGGMPTAGKSGSVELAIAPAAAAAGAVGAAGAAPKGAAGSKKKKGKQSRGGDQVYKSEATEPAALTAGAAAEALPVVTAPSTKGAGKTSKAPPPAVAAAAITTAATADVTVIKAVAVSHEVDATAAAVELRVLI